MSQTEFWLSLLSSLIGAGFGSVVAYIFGNKQIKKQVKVSQEISKDEKKFNILLNARKNISEIYYNLSKNHFYHDDKDFDFSEVEVLEGLYKAHITHNQSNIALIHEVDVVLQHINEGDSIEILKNINVSNSDKLVNYNNVDITDWKRLLNGHTVINLSLDEFSKDYNESINNALGTILEMNKVIKNKNN